MGSRNMTYSEAVASTFTVGLSLLFVGVWLKYDLGMSLIVCGCILLAFTIVSVIRIFMVKGKVYQHSKD